MMDILRKILCILGWHDWFTWYSVKIKTLNQPMRSCRHCPCVQSLHGVGIYKHWCSKR